MCVHCLLTERSQEKKERVNINVGALGQSMNRGYVVFFKRNVIFLGAAQCHRFSSTVPPQSGCMWSFSHHQRKWGKDEAGRLVNSPHVWTQPPEDHLLMWAHLRQ